MKKYARLLIFILTVAIVVFTAVSCLPVSNGDSDRYTVSVELNGGIGVGAESFVKNGKLTEPTTKPVKTGYEFDGWYYDEECETNPVKFGFKIKKDVTVYAKWKKEAKKATFFLGSYAEDIVVEAKDGAVTPPTVTRDGYEFLGWFADAELNFAARFDDVEDGAVFYAKWKASQYSVTYELGGLANLSVSAKASYGVEDAFLLVAPVKIAKGYTFLHWLDENDKPVASVDKGSMGDRVFKAVFISSNKAIESVKAGTVSEKNKDVVIHVPNDESTINLREFLTVSDRASFEITDGDGTVNGDILLAEGANDGYTVCVTAEDGSKTNYGVTVNRSADVEYVVEYFYSINGTPVKLRADETVKAAILLTASLEAEKQMGYVFVGWYTDIEHTQKFDSNTPILANTTLYARYEGAMHDLFYFLGIGVGHNNPPTYTTGVGIRLLDATAPDGYEFKGWSLSTDGNEIITEISANSMEEYSLYAFYTMTEQKKNVYIEDDSFADGQEIDVEEILDILNWAIYHRMPKVEFGLTVADTTGDDIAGLVGATVEKGLEVPYVSRTGSNINVSNVSGSAEYRVTVTFGEFIEPDKSTDELAYKQAAYPEHGAMTEGRASDFEDFAINSILDTTEVSDSEQLYFAVQSGYRPVPTAGSSAERIYEKAKTVLREIVDDKMTDIEKAHAIFDWIILNVTYDNALLELGKTVGEDGKKPFVHDYNGFYLEGVFDDQIAVCDGISKAYVLLCGIEGIECIQVIGESLPDENDKSIGHAWNKIKIDGKWYVVCATSGGTILNQEIEAFDHAYFMTTDAQMGARYVEMGEYPAANTVYDAFADLKFEYKNKEYSLKAKNKSELVAAAEYLIASSSGLRTIDVKVDYAVDKNGINDAIAEAARALNFKTEKMNYTYTDNVLIIIIKE